MLRQFSAHWHNYAEYLYIFLLAAEDLFAKVYLSLLWNKCPNLSRVPLLPDRTTRLGLLCTASAAEAVGLDAMCTTCDMGKKNASLLGKCVV